jgi:hypothetical protein
MHNLEVDTYCDLWRKKYMSIDTLEIEMACITRKLNNCKLQVKYPENLTHKSRFNSQQFVSIYHLHLIIWFTGFSPS